MLTVISDRKLASSSNGTTVDFYLPEVISTTDYYSFGSPMPGRQYSSNTYRYGFNGQLKDDEVYGAGNLNSAEYWEYDTRLGRRWNIDPIDQISISNYACFANNPIYATDAAGSNTNTPISNPEKGDKVNGATYNGTDWDLSEVKITPTTSEEITKREAELNSPVRHYEPSEHQQAIYNFCDKFGQGCYIGAVAGASAPYIAPLAGEMILDELAGFSVKTIIKGGILKSLLKSATKQTEKKVVKETTKGILSNMPDYAKRESVGFLQWVKNNFEKGTVLSKADADEIIIEAERRGLTIGKPEMDAVPGRYGYHVNIQKANGSNPNVHLPVESSYELPNGIIDTRKPK